MKKKIAWVPVSDFWFNNQPFRNVFYKERDDFLNDPYVELKILLNNEGFELQTIDKYSNHSDIDLLIFYDLSKFSYKYCSLPNRKLLVNQEVPLISEYAKTCYHDNFDRVLSWNQDLVDNVKYFYLKHTITNYFPHLIKQSFSEKKLLTLINYNKLVYGEGEIYSERRRAIDYFDNSSLFDLYGYGWDRFISPYYLIDAFNNQKTCKFIIDFLKSLKTPHSYKGSCLKKFETLNKYKFCLCYENIKSCNGYVSEKIFDCFKAGCIPIYYGAPNIQDLIPSESFIDFRNFTNYFELEQFLVNMSEEKYNDYISDAQKFLGSKIFKEWLPNSWAKNVYKHIRDLI